MRSPTRPGAPSRIEDQSAPDHARAVVIIRQQRVAARPFATRPGERGAPSGCLFPREQTPPHPPPAPSFSVIGSRPYAPNSGITTGHNMFKDLVRVPLPTLLQEAADLHKWVGGLFGRARGQCRASMALRINARASAPYTAIPRSCSNAFRYRAISEGWVTWTRADSSSTDTRLSS